MEDGVREHSNEPVWLITGASRGLGMALTEELLAAGARVAATARATGARAVLEHANPERLLVVSADLASRESVESMVGAALDRFGRIDVLVNNAGAALFGTVEEIGDKEILAQLDINVVGPWRFIRSVLPGMRSR